MLTTDLALRMDPAYEQISRRFLENPAEFADAFARAWFKLTHRDMGPKSRYLGPEVPAEELDLAGPGAGCRPPAGRRRRRRRAQGRDRGLGPVGLAARVDRLGLGVDVPRHRQARRRQRRPASGSPRRTAGTSTTRPSSRRCCGTLEGIQAEFNASHVGGAQISLADLIVLGGWRRRRGAPRRPPASTSPSPSRRVAPTPRRSRPTSTPSPCSSRPWTGSATTSARAPTSRRSSCSSTRRQLLTLTAPEMTVLVGGLRVLGANAKQSQLGVLTERPGVLTNDFFVNLLDIGTMWSADDRRRGHLRGSRPRHRRRALDRQPRRPGVRLALGAARARRGLRRATTRRQKFVHDFVAAWTKVMELDRFDVA